MRDQTFSTVLEEQLRRDAGRPLVTFYDDTTGERVELSVTTYANWVAKTAGLLQDELEVERGGLVLVDLPTHWLGPVWLGAAWSLGAVVTDELDLASEADLVVCGPASLEKHGSGRAVVVALSLRPLGGRFLDPLPDGVVDYGAVVWGQPDAFVPYDRPSPSDVAWRDAGSCVTQAEVLASPAGSLVEPGGRLLTDVNPCRAAGLQTLVSPLAAGGGTVWVANPHPAAWESRRAAERTTAELRTG